MSSGPTSISGAPAFLEKDGYNEIGAKLIPQTPTRFAYYLVKYFRNKLAATLYLKNSKNPDLLISKIHGRNIVVFVIAYNVAWTIELLINLCAKYWSGATIVVIDNSPDQVKSSEIREVCLINSTEYVKLPDNNAGHMCRSHGNALNWTWSKIIKNLPDVKIVGFLDHDCYPIKTVSMSEIEKKFIYGVKNPGYLLGSKAWNMWPGYMFLNLTQKSLENLTLDFLPNPLDGLDTGGTNWRRLYKYLKPEEYSFAVARRTKLELPNNNFPAKHGPEIEIIDDSFMHLGGITHGMQWKDLNIKEISEAIRQNYL